MKNPYTHSHALLVDSRSSLPTRPERIARAFGNVIAPHKVLKCKRASDTVLLLGDGTKILVSYNTPVALRRPDGSAVATPHGQYSRTTDRAVADFAANPQRVTLAEFAALLQSNHNPQQRST
jgi:hypothetical protein